MAVVLGRRQWRTPNGRQVYRHLIADNTTELLQVAKDAKVASCWLHLNPIPHFDVAPRYVTLLLANGVPEGDYHDEAVMIRAFRLNTDPLNTLKLRPLINIYSQLSPSDDLG